MKSNWIIHKEKRIYFCDYSNFGSDFEALKEEMVAVTGVLIQEPENSVLILTDVTNTVASPKALDQLKAGMKFSGKHMKRVAVVGVTGVRNIMLKAVARTFNLSIFPFSDIEKAKDWLVEHDH
ncbi:MAG: STAS/SEC14 domain-containing protein [Candidatus Omnitrophota bacterium]